MLSYLFIIVLMIVYDSVEYFDDSTGCLVISTDIPLNNFLWFFTRSINTYLWIIPIIYLFWPKVKLGNKATMESSDGEKLTGSDSLFEGETNSINSFSKGRPTSF